MTDFTGLVSVMIKSTLRDRVLHALLGAALAIFILVPAFSVFSMRQVQELSITLALSFTSFVLLILTVLLGASSIWRDIEKRFTSSVLGLPISRASYIMSKFFGLVVFILACAIILGTASLITIKIASSLYPSQTPVNWVNIIAAIAADSLKYVLLAAVALIFSSLSTSFFLPFFGAITLYLAGSASQEVYEYVTSDAAMDIAPFLKVIVKMLYYVLPNFSAFNFKVQASYGLPLSLTGLSLTLLYFVIYTLILLFCSIWVFSRRELH